MRDLAAGRVHRVGDEPMLADLPRKRQLRRARLDPSGEVRRDAAGDDQPDAAAGALRIERRHAREAVGRFLESRVHRAHQHAVRAAW